MPRVSVIMATYNWSSVLPFSIGSVVDQTFTEWELLVIGDGCTDDSREVVGSIGDPRVHWIDLESPTGHQYGPNNEGLKRATGEVIAYLGHDDLWLPHHLTLALEALDAGADFTSAMSTVVVPDGSVQPPLVQAPGGWMPPSAVVHRKAVTDAVGGWRDFRTLAEEPETELWRRIGQAGYRQVRIPRLTVVKFPASCRPNVYEQRPWQEQAAWLARIRAEPNFEAIELGRLVAGLNDLTRAARLRRQAWRLLTEPSQWPAFFWRRGGARIRARQRYKGATAARAFDGGSHVGRRAEGFPAGQQQLVDDSTRD